MRFRLGFTQLESRENPSVPALDPFGGSAPPPVDPPVAPVDPVQVAIDAVIAGASSTTPTNPPVDPNDPLLIINSIYNVPLVP